MIRRLCHYCGGMFRSAPVHEAWLRAEAGRKPTCRPCAEMINTIQHSPSIEMERNAMPKVKRA